MSTRWRIFLAAVLLIVVPAGLLAGFFRARLAGEVTRRVAREVHRDLARTLDAPAAMAAATRLTLERLARAVAEDNQLRLALVGGRDDLRPYLRDYAGRVALTTRLDVLQLMDAEGRILSSAHYRNEFDRREPWLLAELDRPPLPPRAPWLAPELAGSGSLPPVGGGVFVEPAAAFLVDQDPGGAFLALVGRHDFTLGGRGFRWVGGQRLDGHPLFRESVAVVTPDTSALVPGLQTELDPGDRASVTAWGEADDLFWEARQVPVIMRREREAGLLLASHPRAELRRQLASIDQLVLATLAAALAGSFLLAAWLAGRLSRPLAELADRAARVDLDDPSADLATTRGDEVGELARVLDAMVTRLRGHARRLADAEHRATLGEVARQVNHDLRNGITPVRNVVRHLGETATREPERLAEVFAGRAGTLESSLAYLEDLAGRYARLAPEGRRERCDLGAIAREAAAAVPTATVTAAPDTPAVLADPLSLRRILGNLLRNAQEALPGGAGSITVRVRGLDDPDLGRQCELQVSDDGAGMTEEVKARIFEDFYTTKQDGTGLGLSNVRRLAGDAGGRLELWSEAGRGTTVTITFPAAEAEA
jgi:signal transduction histidine kinase